MYDEYEMDHKRNKNSWKKDGMLQLNPFLAILINSLYSAKFQCQNVDDETMLMTKCLTIPFINSTCVYELKNIANSHNEISDVYLSCYFSIFAVLYRAVLSLSQLGFVLVFT